MFGSVAACSGDAPGVKVKPKPDAAEISELERRPGDGFERVPPPATPDYSNEDGGVFVPPSRASSDGGDGGPRADEGDAGGGLYAQCEERPLKAGDLAVVEFLIQSSSQVATPPRPADGGSPTGADAGKGAVPSADAGRPPTAVESGEWIEVQNTTKCPINLKGVKVSTLGAGAAVATVDVDVLIRPNATVVFAASPAALGKQKVPGFIVGFPGSPGDILKDDGDTVTLTAGAVVIDKVSYPKISNLEKDRSVSFPSECAWKERGDWDRWSYSFNEYAPRILGTPNQDNTDVACY